MNSLADSSLKHHQKTFSHLDNNNGGTKRVSKLKKGTQSRNSEKKLVLKPILPHKMEKLESYEEIE